jgi:hypothetical protein
VASRPLAAKLGSSVLVWSKFVVVLVQVTVPPTSRHTVAGTNRKALVASTVT